MRSLARQTFAIREATQNPYIHFDFVRYHEIEALLRGGEADTARREIESFSERLTDAEQDRRFRLVHLRMQVTLSCWEGNLAAAQTELEAAQALAAELDLPGERWQLTAHLARTYQALGDRARAEAALEAASTVINNLAARINDQSLRQAFLQAARRTVKGDL